MALISPDAGVGQPRALRSVCVFCGSSPGADPRYAAVARHLGETLAARQLRLVYGGGRVGLMGAVADGALAAGGEVYGVITKALLDKEIGHDRLTELRVVDSMHERKAAMSDLADAFVMLPGGFGTWDEFNEAVTWTQLGIHDKACGVLDVAGFYEPFQELLARATEQGFVRPQHRDLVQVSTDIDDLLDALASWRPVLIDKWLGSSDR